MKSLKTKCLGALLLAFVIGVPGLAALAQDKDTKQNMGGLIRGMGHNSMQGMGMGRMQGMGMMGMGMGCPMQGMGRHCPMARAGEGKDK